MRKRKTPWMKRPVIRILIIWLINNENSWYRHAIKRRMKWSDHPEPTDVPGVLFLEIDGLARPVLEKAMASVHELAKSWLTELHGGPVHEELVQEGV